MKHKLIIVGNGTTAETVYNFVEKYKLFEVIGFAVHRKYRTVDTFLGLKNYCLEELDKSCDFLLFIAMQWNRLNRDRREVYEELKSRGFKFANLVSPSSIIHGKLLGDNCWITDQVIIDSNTIIRSNVFVKVGSYIASNCVIDKHCFIGAKSIIAGGCFVGEQTFIGISTTVFDGVKIGDKCLIGACSIVKRDLLPFTKLVVKHEYRIKTYGENEIEQKLLFHKNVR